MMNKKNASTIAKVSTLFVILFALNACSAPVETSKEQSKTEPQKTSEDPIVITSNSGDVRLEIPKSALPEGISAKDISIQSLSASDIPLTSKKANFTGFKLEPDGLKFKENIQLTVPIEKDNLPFFLHSYGENVDLIRGVNYRLSDKEKNEAVVSIDHFSTVIEGVGLEPVWSYNLNISDTFIGEKIPATVEIKLTGTQYDVTHKDGATTTLYIANSNKTINGSFWASDNVSPSSLLDKPTTTSIIDSYTLRSNDFTCYKPGPASLQYRAWISWGVLFEEGGGGAITDENPFPDFSYVFITTTFQCKVPPPPQVPPRCGDNKADDSERCDGTDLRGKTCVDMGYPDGGALSCDNECYYNAQDCKITHKFSCAQNTWTNEAMSVRSFTCEDNCPQGKTCDAKTCTCKTVETEQQEEPILIRLFPLNLQPTQQTQQAATPKVKVIQYGEHNIPADQVYQAGVAECGTDCDSQPHWHSKKRSVKTLSGVVLQDPEPSGCGFGKVSEHPITEVSAP